MKVLLTLFAALAACAPIEKNTFEVDASMDPDAAGTLMLCGEEIPLKRHGRNLTGDQPTKCEGDGVIRIRFKDGRSTDCAIGYVTGGMGQDFRYRLSENVCAASR